MKAGPPWIPITTAMIFFPRGCRPDELNLQERKKKVKRTKKQNHS